MCRESNFYILDILIAIEKIKTYTQEFQNAQEFLLSNLHWDATIRELEIIGEATKYLLKDELLDKSYRRIVDFRNQINHAYFGINENIVWDVIQNKLPLFQKDLLELIIKENISMEKALKSAKEDKFISSSFLKKIEKILQKDNNDDFTSNCFKRWKSSTPY